MRFINKIIGKSKGTISPNSGALIEEPPGFIYEIEIPRNKSLLGEQARWCNANIGVMSKHWDIKVHNMDLAKDTFIFIEEIDAMAFKLAWIE